MCIAKFKTAAVLVTAVFFITHHALGQKMKGNWLPPDITAPIVAIAPDSKAFTVEIRPRAKGEQTQRLNIKMTEQTKLRFWAVTNGGARLVAGYETQVWLQQDSQDTATTVNAIGHEQLKQVPQLSGRVAKVMDGGKKFTIETLGSPAKGKGAGATAAIPAKSLDITIPEKAKVTFSGVTTGGAKVTEGYHAGVFLKEGTPDMATAVRFSGASEAPKKGVMEPPPLYSGRILEVAANEKEVTLEVFSKSKLLGPDLVPVKINESTQVIYMNVPTDGAKLTQGYEAQAWFGQDAMGPAIKLQISGSLKDQGPDLSGPVRSVTPDGKTIVILGKAKDKGQAPPEVSVVITNYTKLIFNSVPLDGAKPAAGMEAQIWLEESTGSTAARIVLGNNEGLTGASTKMR